MRFLLALILVTVTSLMSLAAEDTTQGQLLAIDSAFVTGRYADVELLTLRILQSKAELTPQERARVNLTAGYALIMMNRETEARNYFKQALDAEPNLTLDPVQVSPKFRVVFDEVKAQHVSPAEALARTPDEKLTIRSMPSRQALFSNLILPGSGQWREGHRVRGAVFFVAQAASVAALVWQIGETRDSRAEYLAQINAERISETYDEYNQDYMLSWGAGALAGVVYLAAQADLILHRTSNQEISLLPAGDFGPGLTLRMAW